MKPKVSSLDSVIKPVLTFIHRFHMILFFLLISIGLFFAIVTLLSIINLSSSTATTTTEPISGSFDETTMNQIEQLENSTESKPGSRPSPFVE